MKRRYRCAMPAACLVVLLFAGCGFFPGTASRLKAAQEKENSGDYRGAAAELEAVLKHDSTNSAALLALCRVDLKLGATDDAQGELQRVQALGPNGPELRELTGDVLRARGQFSELLRWSEAAGAPASIHTLVLRSEAQLALNNYPAAEQVLAQAAGLAPDDPQVLLTLARLRAAQGRMDDALAALDHATTLHPTFAPAWLMRGNLAMSRANYAEAAVAFQRANAAPAGQSSVPEVLHAQTGLAEAQLAQGDVVAAAVTIKTLSSRFGATVPSHYLLGRLALQKGDAEAAVNEFRTVVNAAPDNLAFKSLLGTALLAQGSREQALATLAEVVAQNPADQNSRNLLAQAQLASNEPEEARRTLLAAPGTTPADAQSNWLMAASLMRLGDMKGGIPLLERSVASAPNNTQALLDLARAYLSGGQFDKARTLLERLPADRRDASTQRLEVMARIGGKTGPDAARALEDLVKANPADVDLLTIAGAYALHANDTASAGRYYVQALRQQPANVTAQLGMAAVAARTSDFSAATDRLQSVLHSDPRQPQALLAMAGVALRQEGPDAARKWLERAISAAPSTVEARLDLAQIEFRGGNAVRGAALLDQAVAVAADKPAASRAAGEIALAAGRNEAALGYFQTAVRLGDRGAAIQVAQAQLVLGYADAARQTLLEVKEAPYAARANIMLVGMDAKAGKIAEARQRIAAIPRGMLGGGATDELMGDVSWVAGQIGSAESYFSRGYTTMPSQSLALKLFRARLAQKAAAPEAVLERWLERSPADTQVRAVLALQMQQTGRNQAAIAEYEILVGSVNPSPDVLNNLAWAYYQTGDMRAIPTAKRAYDAAGRYNPDIADTYGWLLVEGGDAALGRKILEESAARAPDSRPLAYHLAVIRARSGDKDAAIHGLRTLLSSPQQFEDRAAAERLLHALSAG